MHAAGVGILAPADDEARVEQVRQVAALGEAEVGHLGRLAGPRADVAVLHRHRPELLEQVVGQHLPCLQRKLVLQLKVLRMPLRMPQI